MQRPFCEYNPSMLDFYPENRSDPLKREAASLADPGEDVQILYHQISIPQAGSGLFSRLRSKLMSMAIVWFQSLKRGAASLAGISLARVFCLHVVHSPLHERASFALR